MRTAVRAGQNRLARAHFTYMLVTVGAPERDHEVVWMERFLEEGKILDLNDRAQLREAIEQRKAIVLAGLLDPVAQKWTKKLKKEVEPLLRMRLDPRFGYVIDRWVDSEGWWHKIPGAIGFSEPRPGLCERMRGQYDMWKKATPKDNENAIAGRERHPILRAKDEESSKVIAENERKSTEKVLTAVDSLSPAQVSQFIAVERARHTGEKIIHHGADLKFMETVEKAQKVTPPPPEDMGEMCGNPGMNPKVYTRKTGGKHIRE